MTNVYNNGKYLERHPSWHSEDSAWKAQNICHLIKKNKIEPKSIAEVGCGSGDILFYLSEVLNKNIKYDGFEISKDAYEICNNKLYDNITYHFNDFINQNNNSYDIAMAIDVIEHIEDYYDFLRKFKNKAKYKIFHIPLDLSVQSIIRNNFLLNKRIDSQHIHYFTKETAIDSLLYMNYEIIDYFYTASSCCLSRTHNWGWKNKIMKYPRNILFNIDKDASVKFFGGYSLMLLSK